MKNLLKSYLHYLSISTGQENNAVINSLITPTAKIKVLDVGCNNGRSLLGHISGKIINPQLYGVDIDRDQIKKAKKNGVHAVYADLEKKLPLQSNFFDLIIANQVIEHLRNVDMFMHELFRVLKPEGTLILSTENLASWHNIFALICGWQPFSDHISRIKNIGNPLRMGRYSDYEATGMHVKILTLRSLTELANLHGFTIEKKFAIGYYPFPPGLGNLIATIDPTHAPVIGLKARK